MCCLFAVFWSLYARYRLCLKTSASPPSVPRNTIPAKQRNQACDAYAVAHLHYSVKVQYFREGHSFRSLSCKTPSKGQTSGARYYYYERMSD